MKTASASQNPRFSPLAIAIGFIVLGGMFGAAGYAIALATRPAPASAASVTPVEKRVEPVAEKIEPKPAAKKVGVPVVAKKRLWTFSEAYEEAKAMAERLKDEDFEQAKKNMTQTELLGIVSAYHHLAEGKYSTLHSGVNNESYSIANHNGMANYFNKRIARWSFKDKYFPSYSEFAWNKVASYQKPESILHSAILYGYSDARIEAIAETPVKGNRPANQTVKQFWESFGGCRWSELSD